VGAIFTPPDVISQFMMAVPLWLLYELGIVLANLIVRPAPVAASAAPAGQSDYQPLGDAEMEAQLDKAEADSASNR
jgi:sec-independent protein translocase protein TatC